MMESVIPPPPAVCLVGIMAPLKDSCWYGGLTHRKKSSSHSRVSGNLEDIARSLFRGPPVRGMMISVSLFFDLVGDAVVVHNAH